MKFLTILDDLFIYAHFNSSLLQSNVQLAKSQTWGPSWAATDVQWTENMQAKTINLDYNQIVETIKKKLYNILGTFYKPKKQP